MLPLPTDENPVVIIHGDCQEILPQIPSGVVDAVVTDPPYGIGYIPYLPNAIQHKAICNDDREFDPRPLLTHKHIILWGANNYTRHLPKGGWLVWDKRTNEAADKCLGSPFEIAWCSKPTLYKIARIQHGGAINADGLKIRRQHPTQKPVALMRWCIQHLPKSAGVILDPFAGSGTTGVAAIIEGRKAILIEKDAGYVEVIKKRIAETLGRRTTLANGKVVGVNLFESVA